ncbi:AAA family ATPase [Nocardia sp. CA-107356]|uniref:AAA family ATPase n=1 Tax=Nocardia sp. CA-107356 TaxID=3239972 RepID=UPI003D926493
MRPLRLQFKGLRSYRNEQVIDFTNISLMAIMGDTGAGKSSVFEALCFALYGKPTWTALHSDMLVAHGGDGAVRAELTFLANGKRWRVTRAVPARGRRQDRLVGEDDGQQFNGTTEVDNAIEAIVGLNRDSFLKAVLLPQGKFQELLQATPGNRRPILQAALGLERISDMRPQVQDKAKNLQDEIDKLERTLGELTTDPDSVLEETSLQLAVLAGQITDLTVAAATCDQAKTALATAERCGADLRRAAEQLRKYPQQGWDDDYRQLSHRDAELSQRRLAVESEIASATAQEQQLQAALDDADRQGTGIAGTTVALTTLRSLQRDLPQIHDKLALYAGRESETQQKRTELEARRQALPRHAQQTREAEATAQQAEAALDLAKTDLDLQQSLLLHARDAHGQATKTDRALDKAEAAVPATTHALTEAQQAAAQADSDVDDAEAAVEAVRRRNSAAHAAEGHEPGTLCPVCTRPLPDDFRAPTETDITQAHNALKDAKRRATGKGTALATAQAAHDRARAELTAATAETLQAHADFQASFDALTAAVGPADLSQPDSEILAAAFTTVEAATAHVKHTRSAADQARTRQKEFEVELRGDEKDLIRQTKNVTESLRSWTERRDKALDDYRSIPEDLRDGTDPTAATLDRAFERAEQQRKHLDTLTKKAAAIRQHLKKQHTAFAEVRNLISDDVDKPASRLADQLLELAHRAASVPQLTRPVDIPTRPQPWCLETDTAWAGDLVRATQQLLRECDRDAAVHDENRRQAQTTITTTLAKANATSPEDLHQQAGKAQRLMEEAQDRHDKAVADKPRRAEIEQRRNLLKPEADSLNVLSDLLQKGEFLSFVTEQRQKAVLNIATELLLDMTAGRFKFLDDFMIMDRETGRSRDVKTLSGGETFMASLALALALAQLTSRGGGRIEALFLDEGFGSLDTRTLREAMDALNHQATAGRMIAAITHMRKVADYFDDILLVTNTEKNGSEAHWATPDERDRLIDGDPGDEPLE